MGLAIETCNELICEYSDAPNIYFEIIVFARNNFWRHIVESSAESHSFFFGVNRPTKVTQFKDTVAIQYILWLYISMNDSLVV